MKTNEFRTRPCSACGVLLIDVRDAFTGATYPVEAQSVTHPGLVLEASENPRRNPYARHGVDVFLPHLPRCTSPQELEDDHPAEEGLDINPPSQEGESPTESVEAPN